MKLLLLPLLLLPSGCASSALPADLFTVDFANAREAIMLSRAPRCQGRKISGKSGVYFEYQRDSTDKSWNVHPASAQIAMQVDAPDACVQVERVLFRATTRKKLFARQVEKELVIDASVFP